MSISIDLPPLCAGRGITVFNVTIVMAKTVMRTLAAIYRRSPVGLKVFEKPGDDDWTRLHRLLQELAWETVCDQPLSGSPP